MDTQKIVVYGANWCPLTLRAIAHLKRKRVSFDYIDIEQDRQAAQWVRDVNAGKERKPTIQVGDQILVEPTNAQLDSAIQTQTAS